MSHWGGHTAAPVLSKPSFAVVMLGGTVIALAYWRVGALKLMLGGSVLRVLRSRLSSLHVVRSVLSVSTRF
jgi:hypothetical protein